MTLAQARSSSTSWLLKPIAWLWTGLGFLFSFLVLAWATLALYWSNIPWAWLRLVFGNRVIGVRHLCAVLEAKPAHISCLRRVVPCRGCFVRVYPAFVQPRLANRRGRAAPGAP